MKSLNLEILQERWPEMDSLGGFAEEYAHPDSSGSLIKLRSFAESIAQEIYRLLGLDKPYQRWQRVASRLFWNEGTLHTRVFHEVTIFL
jgi:hypothetical protein